MLQMLAGVNAISHHSLFACVYHTIRRTVQTFSNTYHLEKVPRHLDGSELSWSPTMVIVVRGVY
jgi:hypothetical protein